MTTTKDKRMVATRGLSHAAAWLFRRLGQGSIVIMAGPIGEQEDMT